MADSGDIEIDLTQRSSRDVGFELKPYDPEPRRDWVRASVTVGLVVGFLALLATKDHWDQTKEMLQILLPALTGLLGSALGFYFGTKSSQGK
jgi:hypothetical protein